MFDKYTPERITELKENEIFVFGSNLAGVHGGGAARMAYERFGAVWGQGVGLQGRSYAIPTMQGGVETIKPYVDEFIGFARQHPELTFLVTPIGCGIAGFKEEQIAPLFDDALDIDNVVLPMKFQSLILYKRQLESEEAGMVFHKIDIKYYPEDQKIIDSLPPGQRLEFICSLKEKKRYTVPHGLPVNLEPSMLNTGGKGHHPIALNGTRYAIASGNKLMSASFAWGIEFDSPVVSVVPFESFFVVLTEDKKVWKLRNPNVKEQILAGVVAEGISAGFGTILSWDAEGKVHLYEPEKNPELAGAVSCWSGIKQLSSSPTLVAGLTEGGGVIYYSRVVKFLTAHKDWPLIVKIYVPDSEDRHGNEIYGIDSMGQLHGDGVVPYPDEYWKRVGEQRNVADVLYDSGALIVRLLDGDIRWITHYSMLNYKEEDDFIRRYPLFRCIMTSGDMSVLIDKSGEYRVRTFGKGEFHWYHGTPIKGS